MTDDDETAIRTAAALEDLAGRAIVRLPPEASAALPSRGQVAAEVELDGETYATVIEPDGRRGHWLNAPESAAGRVATGQTVVVVIKPTKAWPEPTVPPDLARALADAPDVTDTWTDITPMARWEWVRWVNATRNPATRERRVEVSIDKMRHGKRRPCCFDLASCTDPELARSGKLIAG